MALVPLGLTAWLVIAGANQKSALEARNMRWLGYMANQIENRVANFDDAVKRWAYIGTNERRSKEASVPANKFGVVQNLDTEICPDDLPNLSVTKDAGKLILHFRQERKNDVPACAKSDLSELVKQSMRKEVFSSVILAERNGNVLFQSDTGQIKLTNIDFLFPPPRETPSKLSLSEAPSAKPPAPPAPGQYAPTASSHTTRPIGDQQYSVYVQPIKLRMGEAKTGTVPGDWLLIGLSDADTPWQRSGPQGLLLVLPLVVLLVALSWPLPRLWLMSPAEPLRQRYLAAAAASSVGILLVLTILGLYFFLRNFADVRTDARLAILAEEIGANLKHELTLSLKQLRILDRRAYKTRIEWLEGDGTQTSLLTQLTPDEVVAPFEYADWINAAGLKEFRWTTSKEAARQVNVSDRNYFKDVMLNHLQAPLSPETGEFAIEQVLSRTTGQLATMLAIPSLLGQEVLEAQRLPVASMAVTLSSLNNAVLPAEFGFAIIEPDGKVIIHSDPSRAMVENLFAECPEVPELAQVVERRATANIGTNYSGAGHRMRVTPLPNLEKLPWTLVVYRKLEPTRVIRAQSMVDATALFVCYAAAVILLAGCLFYLLGRWKRRFRAGLLLESAWWSPHGPGYAVLAAFGFALMLIYWRSLDRATGSTIFYSSIATAVSLLALSAFGLRIPARQRFHRRSLTWLAAASAWLAALSWMLDDPWLAVLAPAGLAAVWFGQARLLDLEAAPVWRTLLSWVMWSAELALCLVILPTFGLGKMAYEYESGLYARELQWELHEAFDQRGEALMEAVGQIPGPAQCSALRHQLLSGLGIGEAAIERCAPTYFYGGPGYNTTIAESAANRRSADEQEREKEYAERLARAGEVSDKAEEQERARILQEKRVAMEQRREEAVQQKAYQFRIEEAASISKKAESAEKAKIAAEWAAITARRAQLLEEAEQAREKSQERARQEKIAAAAKQSDQAKAEAELEAAKQRQLMARRTAERKAKLRDQVRACQLKGWTTTDPEPRLISPRSNDLDRSCGVAESLLPDQVFNAHWFEERPSELVSFLSNLPVLVMAAVELPFDTRQEGVDMRRNQLQPAGDPLPWEWRVRADGGNHYLWLATQTEDGGYQPIARSLLPAFVPWNLLAPGLWTDLDKLPTLWMGIEFWLGMIAVVALFLWWLRAFRLRVRLDNLAPPKPMPIYDPAADGQGRFIILVPAGYPESPLPGYWTNYTRLDLASMDLASPPAVPEGNVLIEHLETCLNNASHRKVCLDLIESVLRIPQRCLVVTTTVEPFGYLRSGGAGAAGEPADDAELSRWNRLTHSLTPRRLAVPQDAGAPDANAVWMSCSAHEKAILTYLDWEKLVAPTAANVAAGLWSRGILRRRPDGRIEFASPRFQSFVNGLQEAPDAALLESHSAAKGISPWAIGVVLVGVVLFFSQEELTSRLLAFLTSVGGGLELLRKHLSASSATGGPSGSAKG